MTSDFSAIVIGRELIVLLSAALFLFEEAKTYSLASEHSDDKNTYICTKVKKFKINTYVWLF